MVRTEEREAEKLPANWWLCCTKETPILENSCPQQPSPGNTYHHMLLTNITFINGTTPLGNYHPCESRETLVRLASRSVHVDKEDFHTRK